MGIILICDIMEEYIVFDICVGFFVDIKLLKRGYSYNVMNFLGL